MQYRATCGNIPGSPLHLGSLGTRLDETYLEVPSPREVLAVLVEGDCHDTICGVECLLHSVAMVNVYVNVQHSLVIPAHNTIRERDRKNYFMTFLLKNTDVQGSEIVREIQKNKVIVCTYTDFISKTDM